MSIIRFRAQDTNISTAMNYANIDHNLSPYNKASATLTVDVNSE